MRRAWLSGKTKETRNQSLLPALVPLRRQQKKKKGRPLVFKREIEGEKNHAKKDSAMPLCLCCCGKEVLLLVGVSEGREERVDVLGEL